MSDVRVLAYVTRQRRGEQPQVGITIEVEQPRHTHTLTATISIQEAAELARDLMKAADLDPDD